MGSYFLAARFVALIEYVPLKQGLRLTYVISYVILHRLIEYVPLKQGLRHLKVFNIRKGELLIEYVPLKQGLRHSRENDIEGNFFPHRVCSIKTRIKTVHDFARVESAEVS